MSKKAKYSKEFLMDLYRHMVLIRKFEEKAGQLYGMGLIGGFCHLYIGQEAVVVGIQNAQQEGDSVITSYRDHGHMLACDMDPNGVMAELTGRQDGYSKGKGGSMHMFSDEKKFYGGHGIVGAQIPIGTGLGFAHQYKKDNGVAIAYMGDGAANQGQVYESFNMASLWKLPVLYIIENNKYAMGTSQKRAAAGEFYKRGEAFDIPGKQVDGMNVLEVYEEAQKALKHIRSGKGPMVLEIMTYRYRGHSMSDPATYRSKEEVTNMKKEHDCIAHLKSDLVKAYKITDEDFKAIDKDIKEIVNASAEFAKNSPEPALSEIWTDVLIDTPTTAPITAKA